MDNKVKYILELLNDTLDLRKKTKDEINLILENKKYQKDEESNDYKYLIKMPMDSVSKENVDKLLNEKNNNENKIKLLQAKSVEEIWSEELEELNNYLEK